MSSLSAVSSPDNIIFTKRNTSRAPSAQLTYLNEWFEDVMPSRPAPHPHGLFGGKKEGFGWCSFNRIISLPQYVYHVCHAEMSCGAILQVPTSISGAMLNVV